MIDTPLHGALSLPELAAWGAVRHGGRRMVFYGEDGQTVATLAEIHARSLGLAGALSALGIGPGDHVAVQLSNRLECTLSYHAILRLGAIVVPIVHIYGPAETTFILRQSAAKALIVAHRWRNVDMVERVGKLGACPALSHVVVIGEDPLPKGMTAWRNLEARQAGATPTAIPSDEIAALTEHQIAQVDVAFATGTLLGSAKISWEATPAPPIR
jgi:acyl-CoA synthetase (AMP-forming)/AMP-acid ligase II